MPVLIKLRQYLIWQKRDSGQFPDDGYSIETFAEMRRFFWVRFSLEAKILSLVKCSAMMVFPSLEMSDTTKFNSSTTTGKKK